MRYIKNIIEFLYREIQKGDKVKTIPSYGKILTLGSHRTENALVGNIIIQEKVDGSLFGVGINKDGELTMRSKGVIIHREHINNMFFKAASYILSIENTILSYPPNTYFYFEYLQNPKHNVLCYERVPTNNLVLFDATFNGKYSDRESLKTIAQNLNVDIVPQLFEGEIPSDVENIDFLKNFFETDSYLGNEKIEGIVIKNYEQDVYIGSRLYPLFTKYVRETFKERHNTQWKKESIKASIQTYITTFRSEARWQKALQHLREQGSIIGEPKDIGGLIKEVNKDILSEEKENIKEELFKFVIKDILRNATHGLPYWYKELLAKKNDEEK